MADIDSGKQQFEEAKIREGGAWEKGMQKEKRSDVPTAETLKMFEEPVPEIVFVNGERCYKVEVSAGVFAYFSPDMYNAYHRFGECVKAGITEKETRDANVKLENYVMGDVVLPIGHEVVYARDKRTGKIKSVGVGYAGCPYYRIEFRDETGVYRVPARESDCTQLYARDLVHYGLTILGNTATP